MAGPYPYPDSSPQQPFPPQGGSYGPASSYPGAYPDQVPSPYPGALPPPVPYPKPRRRKPLLIAGIAILSVAVIAAVVAALVAFGGQEEATDATVTPARAQTAIQDYMDALSRGDTEVVARNASCGLFEEIKDRKADMSLAKLASDAFRRQYKSAEVTSIDKVVTWSPNQAQVLFTMQVQPARAQGQAERQGVAQILTLDDELLICSYLPRTGQF
jgi:hypothetical protein